MKKHFNVKPLIIAAAVSTTAVASLVTANAATDGAIANGISKTFKLMVNGQEVEAKVTSYTSDGDVEVLTYEIDIPDDMQGIEVGLEGDDSDFYIVNEDGDKTLVETVDDEFAIMIDEDGNITQVNPSEIANYSAE